MATVQMNTRIDESVKSAGDAVFERIGYTPSRVVRAMWGYASRHESNPEDVEKMLRTAEGLDVSEEAERECKIALAEGGPCIFESFLEEVGISEMPAYVDEGLSPAEIREQAAIERAIQKGRLDG